MAPNEHNINYGIPRICFTCDADFHFVVGIDKNKLSLSSSAFGTRPINFVTPSYNISCVFCCVSFQTGSFILLCVLFCVAAAPVEDYIC